MADKNCTTSIPMSNWQAGFLAAYLLSVTILTAFAVYSLWSLRCLVDLPCTSQSTGQPAAGPTTTQPSNDQTQPTTSSIGSAQARPNQGPGTAQTQTQPPVATAQTQPTSSTGQTQPAASADQSRTSSAHEKNVETVVYAPPSDHSWAAGHLGGISQDGQLLLLVIFMGAFGSSVYALKSLADYQGDGKLYTSWGTYFVIQPFEGSGIAVLMYLVVRGGFLTGSGANISAVNQFSICALAGLTGAFSDTAFLKLREVFQTLFKPQDDRGGKTNQLQIMTDSLDDWIINTADSRLLKASNGTAPLKWSVDPPLPAGMALNSATGEISGKPTEALVKSYQFTVTDGATPAASDCKVLKLTIKEPVVSPPQGG